LDVPARQEQAQNGDKIDAAQRAKTTTLSIANTLAGHVGLELGNVAANYPFERSLRFPGIQPNSGDGDYSRLRSRNSNAATTDRAVRHQAAPSI
jgi:hypothetical protein